MKRRQRIASGIYADAYGLAATVKVGTVQREKRYPAGTDLKELQRWQHRTRSDLHDEQPAFDMPTRGTLKTDATRYLKQIAGRPGSAADASHLRAWIDRLGPQLRSKITAADVRLALAAWRSAGTYHGGRGTRERMATGEPASEKTLQQRWRVLKHLYKTLDGPKAKTPCDEVERPKPAAATPVGVAVEIVQRVADRLRKRAKGTPMRSLERKEYARYLLLTTTGQRPAQVQRAQREDFHVRESFWIVRGAKGGPTHSIYLNADMRSAVKAFLQADALGDYDDRRLLETVRGCGWPKHLPLYHARHSLAIDAITAGADLGDVQAMLGHASIETTRRFYGPILRLRQKGVGRSLEGRLKIG